MPESDRMQRSSPTSASNVAPDFLTGGGEMGALLRSHDWSNTLGAPETWSQSLRTVVRLMLTTSHPVFMFWGPDYICLYNDAYSPSIGPEMHPCMLGAPGRKMWREIWDVVGPQLDLAMNGGSTWHEDHCIPIVRRGKLEEVYWTYSYSPIDDESAPTGVGGVLCVCTETTHRAQTLKLQSFRLRFDAALSRLTDPREIYATGTKMLGQFLHARRCGYGDIDSSGEFLIVRSDWTNGNATPLSGFIPLYEFGPDFVTRHGEAEAITVEDPLPDAPERNPANAFSFRSAVQNGVALPLLKEGRFAAALYVYREDDLGWDEPHLLLLREVTERIWQAVERSRTDIERDRLTAALRESEARYRSLVESSAAIVWEMPASGQFDTPQSGWSRYTGQSFDQQKGWGWLDAVHAEDQDRATDVIGRAFEAHSDFEVEYRLRGSDGAYRPMFVRAAAVLNSDGSLRGWVGVHRDVSTDS